MQLVSGRTFCRFGNVDFGKGWTRRSVVLVRPKTGGVATRFRMGRGDIKTFSSIENAKSYYENYRKELQYVGAILLLHNKEYTTDSFSSPHMKENLLEDKALSQRFDTKVYHWRPRKKRRKEIERANKDMAK